MAWFRAQRVKQELEARLASSSASNTRGKAERKWYTDGSERLKVRVHDLDVPDGSQVSVTIADRKVATQTVHGGWLDLDIESNPGRAVPDARMGESLAIECGNEILASGEFAHD